VEAHPSAPRLDVALERVLLRVVEHVAGGVQEDDRSVPPQVRVGERGGVLGRVDGDLLLLTELLDRGDAGLDRGVAEARGLGEDEDARRGRLALGRGARRRQEERECSEGVEQRESHDGAGLIGRMAAFRGA
jgi:hypothetical protein